MSPNNDQKKELELISKKEYRSILNGLELDELCLEKGKFSVNKNELKPNSNMKIEDKASFKQRGKNIVHIKHVYKLSVLNKESQKMSFNIECTFFIQFSTEKPLTKEFFDIYKNINLPINTWPYFREFVNNTTVRMNLPALTLPLFKGNL